jgi:hypothetical protein
MARFNLKKFNKVEGKEQYRVEISNRFIGLDNLNTEVDFLPLPEISAVYVIPLFLGTM